MTESTIYQLLASLAGGRVYPYVAPQNTPPPWVIFSLPSDVTADTFGGAGESRVSIQVDAYALTVDEARTIRDQAIAALTPLGIGNIRKIPGYEPDTRLYRATLDAQAIA
ncbi:DUF3168 domain-containing protein [Klebsiella pneumoniae]|uniref:DUF3168 domain-containing protein n=1 Tax=Klebsiella pneumoniae TaxID=573 RepID=UPI001CBACEE8|nr:DUF3168 domain-containing protein [Klebsiella pneumoniae]EKX7637469.1 DUF3168 domain-containing protein [Klebsiella pneumoniae]ELA1308032.1 DUF3168 domain-containing protein [Klebsiella pneumoniae]MBZ1696865.1 DUF3168 domain-containing protein [Klebsiella pneumoniae]HDZ2531251.1 DUF3168 domain-containing protein [Klebsiella pneumoniae]HDZ2539723.1 DUF3168 domain-containing protein [Klebsiella pneumoniae]